MFVAETEMISILLFRIHPHITPLPSNRPNQTLQVFPIETGTL